MEKNLQLLLNFSQRSEKNRKDRIDWISMRCNGKLISFRPENKTPVWPRSAIGRDISATTTCRSAITAFDARAKASRHRAQLPSFISWLDLSGDASCHVPVLRKKKGKREIVFEIHRHPRAHFALASYDRLPAHDSY